MSHLMSECRGCGDLVQGDVMEVACTKCGENLNDVRFHCVDCQRMWRDGSAALRVVFYLDHAPYCGQCFEQERDPRGPMVWYPKCDRSAYGSKYLRTVFAADDAAALANGFAALQANDDQTVTVIQQTIAKLQRPPART